MNILFGPQANPPAFEHFSAEFEFKSFHELGLHDPPGQLVYSVDRGTIGEAIAQQLGDWKPDVLMFYWAEHYAFPPGLDELDCFTVGIVCDWNRSFTSLRENLHRFDYIVAGERCARLLRDVGYTNVESWNVYSLNYPLHKVQLSDEKIYDIFFAGAYGPVYPDRDRYVRRLTNFADRWRVGLFSHLSQEEYFRALGQTRIAFNQSLQADINFRVSEIALSGALMFMEDENLEIRQQFTDRVDCVLFHDGNFEELLEYYLTHEEERRTIAEAGRTTMLAYPPERLFHELLVRVRERMQAGARPRSRAFATRLGAAERQYQKGVQAFNNALQRIGKTWQAPHCFPICERARLYLNEALEMAPNDPRAQRAGRPQRHRPHSR